MNTQALNDIKDLLREVAAGTWMPSLEKPGVEEWLEENGSSNGLDLAHWGEQQVGVTGEPCGFTACAIGHAALDRRFPWVSSDPHYEFSGMGLKFPDSDDRYAIWENVSRHLGVTKDDAFHMFSDERYLEQLFNSDERVLKPTEAMVIERIDQVLAGEDS